MTNIKQNQIADAPTPQNTPASNVGLLVKTVDPQVPNTISEEGEEMKKMAGNPMVAALIEERLNTLIGASSGYVDLFPKVVKNRIISLKLLQKKQMDLETQFQKEMFELEKKYNEKARGINEHRRKIIIGELEPTEEEIEEGKAIEAELEGEGEDAEGDENEDAEGEEGADDGEDEEAKDSEKDKEQIKGIPSFWLTALTNLEPILETITEEDAKVLEHLVDIRLEYLENPGFKLVFEFEKNDYFTNKQLEKTYYYQKELGYTGEFIYDHAEGCDIDWVLQDKNVTIRIERRKQRNKNTKQTRTIEKVTPTELFFNFFDPPKPPSVEDDEDEDEEDQEELETRLQLDYHIAEEIKDKLVTRAVDWFTGAAVDYIDYEEMEEAFEEGSDEEDDEEGSDGDEEGAVQKDPQECKQQ